MNNETKRTKISVQDMVQLSVLIAILLLLELTGLGMIKTAGLEITIMLVPVIVGAIVMGPAAGALLGGVRSLPHLCRLCLKWRAEIYPAKGESEWKNRLRAFCWPAIYAHGDISFKK